MKRSDDRFGQGRVGRGARGLREEKLEVGRRNADAVLSSGRIYVPVTELGIGDAVILEQTSATSAMEQMHKAVGGLLQPVTISHELRREMEITYHRKVEGAYVNEEGYALSLSYNPFASAMLGMQIVGPMIIVFRKVAV